MKTKVLCLTVASAAADAGRRRLGEPMDDATIRTAVDLWLSNRAAAMATYGHVSTWETGAVTDMSYLFCAAHERFGACSPAAEAFNDDIGAWDTSSVTDVSYMFAGSPNFNQDLGAWSVDRVTDLRGMFDGAAAFDQDLGWCVAGDAAQDGAFAASACAAAACGTSKGTRLYAKDCGGGDDGCGGDLLVGDGHYGGDWQCAGDLRCGIGNCGDFRGGADWDPSESGAHWDLADDCCYEPGVVHAAPEALRVVCPAPPEKSEGRKDADDDHATAITAGVVLGLVLLAFCASQRRRLRKPEPPRAADPEAGKAEPTHDLQRENDALRETIQRLHDDLAKATAGVGGVVVALEAGARTEATTDDSTRENEALQATIQRLNDQLERATAPEGVEFLDVGTNTDTGGLADLALEFDASSLSSGSGSDAGTASSKAGSDVRREDITRPYCPDYHGKMTPGAMEAGLADAGDADQNGSPRTPPKSVEHQLLLEYKKLKKAQRQKRQNEEKAPEAEPPDQALSYDDVVTGRRDRTGETCNPS